MVKKVGKYELGRGLGEGTFGKVKYAVDTETNEAVAIKILDKEKIQKQNMGNQIKKEISIMKMVKHKYIVGMKEVLASKTKIFIVLDLVTGGELFDKIVQVGKLSEEQARFYFQQLVEGVEYCHKLGICHRDLKPENLLLDEHGNLKISDFGLSSLYIGDAEDGASRTELLHTTCGTPNYVAPEVLSDQGYDGKKADVWSIGVILYVLLAGFLPFDESTIVALFAKIQAADFTYPSWFTPETRSLLDQMLVADPAVRLTLTQIKAHPWFQIESLAGGAGGGGGGGGDAGASGSGDQQAPTPEQIEAAMQNHEETAGDDFEDYVYEGSEPLALNAFDMVSHCGGFMLDKMFSPEIFYSVPGMEEKLRESAEMRKVGGSILFGGTTNVKSKVSHFTANDITAQDLAAAVVDGLAAGGFTFEAEKEVMVRTGVIKASLRSPKGMVGMFAQTFTVSPKLSLLELRKGKGDLLEYKAAYSDLLEKKLSSIINIPAEDD